MSGLTQAPACREVRPKLTLLQSGPPGEANSDPFSPPFPHFHTVTLITVCVFMAFALRLCRRTACRRRMSPCTSRLLTHPPTHHTLFLIHIGGSHFTLPPVMRLCRTGVPPLLLCQFIAVCHSCHLVFFFMAVLITFLGATGNQIMTRASMQWLY
jgi:hypothetical protein